MYLYIHIPFCSKRCDYCDFVAFENTNMQNEYVEALIKEINILKEEYPTTLKTVYIGGGTPSLLSLNNMDKIILAISKNFGMPLEEFTMELNPEDVSFEKFKSIKEMGINRLSMGVQSFNDDVLQTLGRIGSYSDSLNSYNILRKIGFKNISLDLIHGIPNQSMQDLEMSVSEMLRLKPEHVSIYSLIVSKGTKLYSKIRRGTMSPLDDDIIADQFDFIIDEFAKNGYNRYEISNFALENFESIHNSSYWNMSDTLGVGIASVYKIGSNRYENTSSFRRYLEYIKKSRLPYDRKISLSEVDKFNEKIMMGFRLKKGFKISDFNNMFNIDFLDFYSSTINKYMNLDMLKISEDYIHLTNAGMNVANSIICDFMK